MKYTRKFTRKQESKYLPQAAKRSHHELTISIMAGVLAMCFALSPVVQASTYSRADGGPAAVVNGHTADIYAGKMIYNQTIAVNNFKTFNVSSGDIANMHFNTAAGNPKADNLVNFSRNAMDINGTINAMGKGGSGTGNIYFFTPQGITVGANGMINATNIYMAVPSSATMDRLIADDNYTTKVVSWGDNFNTYANDTSFPLNPSGTITLETASSLNYTNTAQLLANKLTVKDEGIQRTDGGDTNFINTGNGNFIIEVFAGKIFPNTSLAVNTFDQYNVKNNEIVYMFFSTMDGNDDGIYNLVNLVNKRININGEVDAIKANLNEANMYFLSPEGTTIGPNGIINAGYYVNLAPTTSEYNKLLKGGYDDINAVTTNPEKIEINPNSTITINGVINTYNGMLIRAGKSIDVVSAVKDDLGTVSKPSLNSSIDFAKMVKLTPTQHTYVNPNAKANLQYTKNGDIVLDVYVNNANNNGNFFTKNGDIATINQEGTINARGKVKLAAEAHSKDNLVAIAAPDTEATINVKGKITGANVDIRATAENEDRNNFMRKFVKNQVEANVPGVSKIVKFNVSKAAISSKANVNVEGDITATGATQDTGEDKKDRAITIKAQSKLISDTNVNRKPSVEHDTNDLNLTGTWLTAENEANVNIKGSLHSADGANITSNAHSNLTLASSVFTNSRKIKDEKGQPFALALSKLSGYNTAKTTLERGSELKLDGGDVNVTSNADHLLNSSTTALGDKEGGLSAAISYTNYNSTGRTEVGTGIVTKSGSVTIQGTDTVKDNTVSTNTAAGKAGDGSYHSVMDDVFLGDKDSLKNIVTGWIGSSLPVNAANVLPSLNGSLALQKVTEENKGTVIIHDVPIKASGKVNIHSELDMQDIAFNVDGKAYNRSGNINKVGNIVSSAALISDMTNKSETIVDGGKKYGNTGITGAGVSITASTKLPENAYTRALNEVKSYDPRNAEDQSTTDNVISKIVGLTPYIGSRTANKDVFEKYWGIIEGSPLTVGNYANFSVRALTDQGTDDTFSKSNGYGLSLNHNTVTNTSTVSIGKNRAISSLNNPLETKSEVTGVLTSVTGNPGDTLTSAMSRGNLVGGSISDQTYNNQSISQIGQGSSLKGSKVDVNAANRTTGIELVLGSGVGQDKVGVNGMASIMRGSQSAIAAVDKTVDLTATDSKEKVSITADNHPIIFNTASSILMNSGSNSETAGSAALGLAANIVDVNTFAGTTDLTYGAADREKNAKLQNIKALIQQNTTETLQASESDQTAAENTETAKNIYTNQMGKVEDSRRNGRITAGGLDVHATSDGGITSFGANGAATDGGTGGSLLRGWGNGIATVPMEANKLLGFADNFVGNQTKKLTQGLTRWLKKKYGWQYLKTDEKIQELDDLDKDGHKIVSAAEAAAEAKRKAEAEGIGAGAGGGGAQDVGSNLDWSAAGSGAINVLNENTIAVVDNADIRMKDKGAVSVQATEDVRNLAIAGAGALNAFAGSSYEKKTTIGANGTLALNNNTHNVVSTIRGSNIYDAGSVSTTADTKGDEMALGLGAGVGLNGAKEVDKSVNGGGVAGLNMSTRTTEASISGDSQRGTIKGSVNPTEITVKATDSSISKAIATGLIGGQGVDVGFAGAYNGNGTADNPSTVKATVSNMDITDASKVAVNAEDTSRLNTVSAGLAGSSGSAAVNASYGQAKVNKQVNALVDNTNINHSSYPSGAQLMVTATNNSASNTYGGAGVLNISKGSGSNAGVGASVGINTINTDVNAKVQGGKQNVAFNSQVKAKSNADIFSLSGGVAGTTKGKGSGIGSASYNNITNNVNATASGTTMYSRDNIGIIAESNDRLNSIAGGLNGSRMISTGMSVGVNRINGDTNALVENSNITALGGEIVGPYDAGVIASDIEDGKLISDRNLNPFNSNTRLLKARKDKTYQGLLVHSSGTHDVTAVEGTAGVTIGTDKESAVTLVGSLGFNNIQGSTNALIKNSKVNKDSDIHAGNNNVNVLAKDYTNTQSMAGGLSLDVGIGASSLQGTADGSAESNTVGRSVTAKVIGTESGRKETTGNPAYSIKAKNFNVEATSKQHISSAGLDAAVTVSPSAFINASGAAGASWNDYTGATEAGVEGAHVLYTDSANVNAIHDGATYGNAGALAATVAFKAIAGAAGFVSAVNHDTTGTTAYVKNSIVQVADNNLDSKVTVDATNTSKIDNLLGAVGFAFTDPHAPLAIAAAGTLSKNNLQSTTSVLIDNSTITAGRIESLANNTETINTKLGGAGLGLGIGAGASVGLNYINDRQYATVSNSELHALGPDKAIDASTANDKTGAKTPTIEKALVVGTGVTRNTDESTNAASGGIGALTLDWMETKVNYEDKGDAVAVDAADTSAIAEAKKKINAQNAMVESMFGDLVKDLNGEQKKAKEDNLKFGAHTFVLNSELKADKGSTSVTADEKTGYNVGALSIGGGVAGAMGSVAKLKENHQVDVNVNNSDISGTQTTVMAHRGNVAKDGSLLHTRQGSLTGVSADVSWATIDSSGNTGTNITDSSITATAGKTEVQAKDETKMKTIASGLQLVSVTIPSYNNAETENNSTVGVTIDGSKNTAPRKITGTTGMNIYATKATETAAEGWGYSIGIASGVGTFAKAIDSGATTVTISGDQYTIGGDKRFEVIAKNVATAESTVSSEGAGIVDGVGRSKGEAILKGKAGIDITAGNTFTGESGGIEADMGSASHISAKTDVFGGAAGALASVASDSANATSDTEAEINVGSQHYLNSSTGGRLDELAIRGFNQINRKATIWGHSSSILTSVGHHKAITQGNDRTTVTAGGGAAKRLIVSSYNASESVADSRNVTTSGVVNASPFAAEVENSLRTASEAFLKGHWDVDNETVFQATERDAAKGHADSSNLGLITSVGSADLHSTINDYRDKDKQLHGTHAVIDKGATLNTGTLLAKSINYIDAGKTDNTSENVSTGSTGLIYGHTQNATSSQSIDKSSQVTVEKRDDSLTSVQSSGKQIYEASTTNVVTNKAFASASGAAAEAGVKGENVVKATDKVNINGKIAGSKNEDIITSAWNDSDVNLDTEALAAAGFGGSHTYNKNILQRNNEVNIGGEVADLNNLHVLVNKRSDETTPNQKLYSVSFNNDYAVGTTNKPNVESNFEDNSKIKIANGALKNVNNTHVELNLNQGISLDNYLKERHWDAMFWPFTTHVKEYRDGVLRTGTSNVDALAYFPDLGDNRSLNFNLGYEIGGMKALPIDVETGRPLRAEYTVSTVTSDGGGIASASW